MAAAGTTARSVKKSYDSERTVVLRSAPGSALTWADHRSTRQQLVSPWPFACTVSVECFA